MSRYKPIATAIRGMESAVLYLVVNDKHEITTRMSYNAILQTCEGVHKNDPFSVVYARNDSGCWYKGEYCYSNQRYNFTFVGMAAVPDVILMMELVKP